jgi:hypothetical protein
VKKEEPADDVNLVEATNQQQTEPAANNNDKNGGGRPHNDEEGKFKQELALEKYFYKFYYLICRKNTQNGLNFSAEKYSLLGLLVLKVLKVRYRFKYRAFFCP